MVNTSKEIAYKEVYFNLKYNKLSKNVIILFSKNLPNIIFFL